MLIFLLSLLVDLLGTRYVFFLCFLCLDYFFFILFFFFFSFAHQNDNFFFLAC